MRGGNRKGAGRKSIPESEKKKSRNIYMTDDMYNEIMDMDIEDASNFSQKCNELIDIGLQTIKDTDIKYNDDINSSVSCVAESEAVYSVKTDNLNGYARVNFFSV